MHFENVIIKGIGKYIPERVVLSKRNMEVKKYLIYYRN